MDLFTSKTKIIKKSPVIQGHSIQKKSGAKPLFNLHSSPTGYDKISYSRYAALALE